MKGWSGIVAVHSPPPAVISFLRVRRFLWLSLGLQPKAARKAERHSSLVNHVSTITTRTIRSPQPPKGNDHREAVMATEIPHPKQSRMCPCAALGFVNALIGRQYSMARVEMGSQYDRDCNSDGLRHRSARCRGTDMCLSLSLWGGFCFPP